jgi:nitrogen fixation NifU-like protein
MDETPFDFWQDHSSEFLAMAFSTDHREILSNPDGRGKKTGDCHDTVEMFVVVRNEKIASVSFDLDGCLHTHACANTVAHLATGKRVEAAWEITPEAVADYLKTLPADHFHCAELAVGAFYLALADYQHMARSAWKRGYANRSGR